MTEIQVPGYETIQPSVVRLGDTAYGLLADPQAHVKKLVVQGDQRGFAGDQVETGLLCERTPENAAALRSRLPWLNPAALGRGTSFGFGDRLGCATPGHTFLSP